MTFFRARNEDPVVLALAGLLPGLAILFGGLNSGVGQAVVLPVASAFVAMLVVRRPPPTTFWRDIAPVLACAGLGLAWIVLPRALLSSDTVASLTPDLLWVEVGATTGLFICFVGAAMLSRGYGATQRITTALLVAAVANLALGVVIRDSALVDSWRLWSPDARRFSATLNNPNVAGAYFGAMAMLALSRALGDGPPVPASGPAPRQVVWATMTMLFIGACASTASRSAMLFTVIAAGMLMVRFAVQRRRQSRLDRRSMFVASVSIVLLAITIVAAGVGEPLVERAWQLRDSPTGRSLLLFHFSQVAAQAPWFGYGPGSFSLLNTATLPDPRSANEMWRVNSPHNVVLQLMLDGGIGYLLAIGGAAMLMAIRIVRRARHSAVHAGIAGALLVLLGCSLVDISLDVPAMLMLALCLAGLGWSEPRAGGRRRPRREPHASAAAVDDMRPTRAPHRTIARQRRGSAGHTRPPRSTAGRA